MEKPTQNIPYKNLKSGSSTSDYVEKLVLFIKEELENFDIPVLVDDNENQITEKIYRFLTRRNRLSNNPYFFQPEALQRNPTRKGKGHDSRADLGINLDVEDIYMELIYCIEAKKLPTDQPGYPREKEYVLKEEKKGGIERFKNNLHGKNRDGVLLPRNGMIGYILEKDFNHWLERINLWIENDTIWGTGEYLNSFTPFLKTSYSKSSHVRISYDTVNLDHFWLDLK